MNFCSGLTLERLYDTNSILRHLTFVRETQKATPHQPLGNRPKCDRARSH